MSDKSERYTEEEIALILRRAAEAQSGRSLTLTELEGVAVEAGIDAALVRRAATELRTQPAPAPAAAGEGLFSPTTLTFERRVAGQVDASAWEELVGEIRRHLKLDGSVEQFGKELVWSSQSRGERRRQIRVNVASRRGQTSIRIVERTGQLSLGLHLGLILSLLPVGMAWILPICIEALGAPILIPFLLAAWVWGSYRLARTIYRGRLAERRQELEALAERLVDASSDLAALPPGPNKPEQP